MAEKVEELAKIIDCINIIDNVEAIEEHSRDLSFVPRVRPRFVVKPQNADEVRALIGWANDTLTPLVPVSSGPPHFRGDTIPATGGEVIADLSGMNRIIRIDRRNRVAMIEPGVTFSELVPKLEQEGLRLNMPLLPRSSKSVIGSMMEREPIVMPSHQWDCTDPMLCAEIIFGTGDIMRSGEAAGPESVEEQWKAGKAQMCPFGLSQMNENRLISGAQGTIGIVTWATLKCRFTSNLNKAYFVPSDNLEPLINLTYKLMRIKLGDNCFILNGLNLASFRESSELEFGADAAYILTPDPKDDAVVVLRHLKARYADLADIELEFDRPRQRFTPVANRAREATAERRGKIQAGLAALWNRTAAAPNDESEGTP